MKHGTIKKAVIPVAGLGTRFLPATKVVPKELLPIVDKPALQYVIEEAVNAGLTDIILVTNPAKTLIEEHFRSDTVYDELLRKRGKHHLLKDLHELSGKINIHTVVQEEPLGLGHAVLCAKEAVGDDWFVVLLPDMLIDAEPTCTEQMISVWRDIGKAIIATEHSTREKIESYGIIAIDKSPSPLPVRRPFGGMGEGRGVGGKLHKVSYLIEKPQIENAPSDLFIVGRYLLPASVFGYIGSVKPGCGGEIQITDALSELAKAEGMFAYEYSGILHDTGDKTGYLKANIHYAMKRVEYAKTLGNYIKGII